MKILNKAAVLPVAALMALAGFVGSNVSASAQMSDPMMDKTHLSKRYHDNMVRRPLTVRRRMAAPAVVAAPGPVVAAPVAAASTLVALPFQVLGGVFPGGNGPRKGGVTAVRFAGSGAETDKIDEGWAQPIPVDRSGPIYVVENGDPTISPLTFIGAPIQAAGSIAQLPFRVLGAPPAPGTL